MISKRNLALLAAVVLVLVGISVLQGLGHRRATSRAATTVLLPGAHGADDLSRIELGQGADAKLVVLANGPDGWTVETSWGARASRERIDALLKALTGLSGEFRSGKRDVLPDYGLGESDAVTIRAFGKDGQPAFALEVGNRPQGAPGSFVKLPGKDDVYLTQTGVLGELGIYGSPQKPAPRYFLELQVVKEDRVAVDAVRLRDGAGTREFAKVFTPPAATPGGAAAGDSAAVATLRATWEWKLQGGGRAQPLAKTKVDAVLNGLVGLRASDVADPTGPAARYGLDAPAREATLVMADGRQLTLEFGADRPAAGDQPGGTWLRVRGQPGVWVVSEYTVKNVFKTLAELKPD